MVVVESGRPWGVANARVEVGRIVESRFSLFFLNTKSVETGVSVAILAAMMDNTSSAALNQRRSRHYFKD